MKKILIALLALALVACKPTQQEIRTQVVDNLLKDGNEALFEVQNFQKTNGFEKNERVYIADVEYDLVFKQSVEDLVQQIKNDGDKSPLEALGAGFNIVSLQVQYGNFKAGDRVTRKEKVTLVKTEKGWRLQEEYSPTE